MGCAVVKARKPQRGHGLSWKPIPPGMQRFRQAPGIHSPPNSKDIPQALPSRQATPRHSWQGPDQGLGPAAAPDRSCHERHVEVLEKFMHLVQTVPDDLERLVAKRRSRIKPVEASIQIWLTGMEDWGTESKAKWPDLL
ncbi:unnamed protein product [Effrenium voratum]|uniref:Uncharacterized protein n=1 Tax=Effrenium voratum TaxID=2562239 RepID=A0AA36JSF1_9DINO|nr:unnamed protein product [Effrenium voratum]CAJ1410936.1 unnamed protein product [Effrenium voratum]